MSESKKNKAVALRYNVEEDVAPVIIAAGYGEVAQRIIDVAEKKGIPVFRDDSAASLLCMLEVGSNIPRELYEIVAAIYCQLLDVSAAIKNQDSATPERLRRAIGELPIMRRRREQADFPQPPPAAESGAPPEDSEQTDMSETTLH